MHIHGSAITWLWIAWVAYWWISARWTKADQRRESGPSRAAHMVPLMVAFVLLSQPSFPVAVLSKRLLPYSVVAYGIGTAIVAAGLGLLAAVSAALRRVPPSAAETAW